jgi:hypothetical protein
LLATIWRGLPGFTRTGHAYRSNRGSHRRGETITVLNAVDELLLHLRGEHAEVGSRTIAELEAERDEILLGLIELRTKRPETIAPREVAAE